MQRLCWVINITLVSRRINIESCCCLTQLAYQLSTESLTSHFIIISCAAIQSIKCNWVFLQVCHFSHLSVCLSAGLCVWKVYCGKTAGSRCHLGWWVGSVEGCIRWGGDRQRRRGSFGGKCRTSHCDQWGLCGIVILCREGWQRGFSQITLGFLVSSHCQH